MATNRNPFKIIEAISQLGKVVGVSNPKYNDEQTMDFEVYKQMLNHFTDKNFTDGAAVTFHFEDKTTITIKFNQQP